ncbi:hypothetical protein KC906_03155, partial [Candidatus Kaiserbacteria bacterium]|nr:hypothetical protein [Candidatus Kaiserbacteria bacterium]
RLAVNQALVTCDADFKIKDELSSTNKLTIRFAPSKTAEQCLRSFCADYAESAARFSLGTDDVRVERSNKELTVKLSVIK